MEGDAEECFRSVLEMFWLIDSAINAEKARVAEEEESLKEVSCK